MSNTHLNILNIDLSKKLKSFGFNYWTEYYFDNDGKITKGNDWANYNLDNDKVAAPSAIIVRQWLRNEYDCDVFICRLGNITISNIGYSFIIYVQDNTNPIIYEQPFETFEDAEVAAIEYILNNVMKYEEQETE